MELYQVAFASRTVHVVSFMFVLRLLHMSTTLFVVSSDSLHMYISVRLEVVIKNILFKHFLTVLGFVTTYTMYVCLYMCIYISYVFMHHNIYNMCLYIYIHIYIYFIDASYLPHGI